MALAQKNKNGLTIWSHAQGMYPLRGAIAKLVNLKEEQVRCIHEPASGCFGHNGADDAAADAAIIAMHLPAKAIRLQYSRDDEFRWEPYGSVMTAQVAAVLDNEGSIQDWQYHVWSCTHTTRPGGAKGAGNFISAGLIEDAIPQPPARVIPRPRGGGDRNAVPLYSFPNMNVTKHFISEMPLRVSALRTLGAYANVFSIESFMDELSDMAGADPIDFRIKHLKDQRAIAVLEKLRKVSNWSAIESKESTGKGIGFARYKNSSAYTAVAFFVRVDKTTGDIKLEKAVSVTDAGQVINPDGLKNQIEGGIIQAASWTLKEQVNFTREQVVSLDWSGYPILRFSEVPEMETHLIDRPDEPSLGGGESSQGPGGAALANAVANALGRRLRDIPFTRERVQAAGV
jgi:CO/xanthine dehydrogenase Mo-binding subunit